MMAIRHASMNTNSVGFLLALAASLSVIFDFPAKADWGQEMRACEVEFKNNFSREIAKNSLFVQRHDILDSMAYDYCQMALTAIASGDSMSTAIELGMKFIRSKYDF